MPVSTRQRSADECDWSLRGDLAGGVGPPIQDAKAQRLEILGADAIQMDDVSGRVTGDRDLYDAPRMAEFGQRDGGDSGDGLQFGYRARPEPLDPVVTAECVSDSDRYRVQPVGVEAHVHRRRADGRAHEQRRQDDEEHRGGGLGHDEHGSQPPRRHAVLVSSFALEWRQKIGAATVPGRRQPCARAADECHDAEKQVDVEVRCEVGAGRRLDHRADHRDRPVGERQADGCGDRSEGEAFRHQLPHDSPAARAERCADPHLALTA